MNKLKEKSTELPAENIVIRDAKKELLLAEFEQVILDLRKYLVLRERIPLLLKEWGL